MLRFIKFFKSELMRYLLIFVVGTVLITISSVLFFLNENIIVQTLLMGIGCSLIASSIVAFLTNTFGEKSKTVIATAEAAGLEGEKSFSYISTSIQNARKNIRVMSKTPINLIKANLDVIKHKMQDGVRVQLLVEYDENSLTLENINKKYLFKTLKAELPQVEVRYLKNISQRIIATDDKIFVTSLLEERGKINRIFAVSKDSPLYDSYRESFERLWEQSSLVKNYNTKNPV